MTPFPFPFLCSDPTCPETFLFPRRGIAESTPPIPLISAHTYTKIRNLRAAKPLQFHLSFLLARTRLFTNLIG
jgi:hypothetical protein